MPSTVDEIKELWPFLFFKDYLLQHFQELMGFELHVVFMETVERKAEVIFDYMKQELSRKRVKDSVKLIEDAMEFQEPKAVKMTGVCLLLLAYFDEEEEKMIRCFDVSNIIFNFNLADRNSYSKLVHKV
jgi:glutaredoxin-related protein